MSDFTYLDLAGYRNATVLGVTEIDYVEQDSPGFTLLRSEMWTSWIHQRLRKRYGKSLPFTSPYPKILTMWLVALLDLDVMRKRGINPQDPFLETLAASAETAKLEVKEAADSKEGLFDLESKDAANDSNVTTGGPLGYSETSPYVSAVREGRQGRYEDSQGSGSGDD